MSENDKSYFCSRLSVESGEAVFGTASRADVWFLLEYTDSWDAQILPNSKLPDAVKAHLSNHLSAVPRSRLQFIKREMKPATKLAFYVAVSSELNPLLYKLELETYQDLLKLDLTALVTNGSNYNEYLISTPLFLVCTHGKHDQCCAKFGLPIYKMLSHLADDLAWQCSHVGGDRFAPNVLCFPHGIYYGHVQSKDVGDIIQDYQNQRIFLEKYRGRSCYNSPTQVAEYYLRKHTNNTSLTGLKMLETKRISSVDQKDWAVVFSSIEDKHIYIVRVLEGKSDSKSYRTCHAPQESTVPEYKLLKIINQDGIT